jgi:predicted anti-sigma-YlaC factor YlaD
MKCRQVHKNIIDLIEHTLPESVSDEMFRHIKSCLDCGELYDNVSATYTVINSVPKPEINPFFFTRLQQRLESGKQKEAHIGMVLIKRLQPIAIIILLFIGISSGIFIGKNLVSYKNNSDQKAVLDAYASEYYLNKTGEEALNTLLTNE